MLRACVQKFNVTRNLEKFAFVERKGGKVRSKNAESE